MKALISQLWGIIYSENKKSIETTEDDSKINKWILLWVYTSDQSYQWPRYSQC